MTTGDHIHANIPKNLIPNFSDLLKEGKVYTIKNFQVSKAKKTFKTVNHPYIIRFLPITTLKAKNGEFPNIPQHRFEFVQLDDLHSRLNRDTYLTGKTKQFFKINNIQVEY